MAHFQLEDLDPHITERMRLHIADVILRWAAFDTAISYWIVLAFGMPMDACSILLGNMDTRNKLDKLHKLHQHFDHHGVTTINKLRTQHKKYVEIRNIIAHQRCAGFQISDPDFMVFHSIKHITGQLGEFEVVSVSLGDMRASATWAEKAEKMVRRITDTVREPLGGRERR